MTARSLAYPFAMMKPRRGGRPAKRILIDPYDNPLPIDQRPLIARPGYHKGRVPYNKGRRFPVEILTPTEVAAILEAFSTVRSGPAAVRNRAILATLYRSGMRINEALHLREKDIFWNEGMIRVLFGKGQTSRTVGIDQGGLDFIREWIKVRERLGFPESSPLFCSTTKGLLLSRSTFSTSLKIAAKRAKIIKRVHPHGFRHAFAFELVMEGVQLPIIQVQLGHMWATSTCIYINHIAPADVIARIRSRTWILQPSVRPGYNRADDAVVEVDRRLTSTPSALRIQPGRMPLALVRDTVLDVA